MVLGFLSIKNYVFSGFNKKTPSGLRLNKRNTNERQRQREGREREG